LLIFSEQIFLTEIRRFNLKGNLIGPNHNASCNLVYNVNDDWNFFFSAACSPKWFQKKTIFFNFNEKYNSIKTFQLFINKFTKLHSQKKIANNLPIISNRGSDVVSSDAVYGSFGSDSSGSE